MNKNQLKKIIVKESLDIVVFALIGVLGHLVFSPLYNYYVQHFSTRSNVSYPEALRGWWFLIVVGYFLYIFMKHNN